MSPNRTLSREERALEDFLHTTKETVAVCLTEPFHPGSQLMADRARAAGESQQNFHVISLGLETHRAWAEKYEAFGTPAMLLFRNGKLARRLYGVIEQPILRQILDTL